MHIKKARSEKSKFLTTKKVDSHTISLDQTFLKGQIKVMRG